jgi:hypothetical protein
MPEGQGGGRIILKLDFETAPGWEEGSIRKLWVEGAAESKNQTSPFSWA